jgi:hypothetical protein
MFDIQEHLTKVKSTAASSCGVKAPPGYSGISALFHTPGPYFLRSIGLKRYCQYTDGNLGTGISAIRIWTRSDVVGYPVICGIQVSS